MNMINKSIFKTEVLNIFICSLFLFFLYGTPINLIAKTDVGQSLKNINIQLTVSTTKESESVDEDNEDDKELSNDNYVLTLLLTGIHLNVTNLFNDTSTFAYHDFIIPNEVILYQNWANAPPLV